MNRLIFFAVLLALLPSVVSEAQAASPTEPSAANPAEPFSLCNPRDSTTMRNCYFSCTDRRRPADAPCVVPPKPTFAPDPEYTDLARKKRIQGDILLQITVSDDGKVADAKVSRSLEPSLDKQSVETIRKWRFQPATLDGKPVSVVIPVETTFRLR